MSRNKHSGPRFFSPAKARAKAQPQGEVQLTITRLSDDGRGVASLQGKTCFVRGALPGEQVLAHYSHSHSRYHELNTSAVIKSAPQRQTPVCPHYHQCGGCNLQHLALSGQLAYKQQQLQQQLRHVDAALKWLPSLQSPPWHYRQRLRLAVHYHGAPGHSKVSLGFKSWRSQNIVAISQCPIAHPALPNLLPALQQCLRQWPAAVTQIQLQLAYTASQQACISICLHTHAKADPQHPALHLLVGEGRQLNLLTPTGLVPVGPQLALYQPGSPAVPVLPAGFTQANAVVNQQMLATAISWLTGPQGQGDTEGKQNHDHLLDAFCGSGNFSLALAKHCARITAVEGDAAMVAALNAAAQQANLRTLTAIQADLFGEYPLPKGITKVLLDPPRAGASKLCQTLAQANNISHIVYVSCNPATLARDCQILQQGGWQAQQALLADMFPHTHHCEAMVLLQRNPVSSH